MRRIRETHCCRGKATSIKYYECVSAVLVIQHAKRMRRIMLSGASVAVPYFSTSHKRHDFREKVIGHKMSVLIFSTIFVRNISHSKKNSSIYYNKCITTFM